MVRNPIFWGAGCGEANPKKSSGHSHTDKSCEAADEKAKEPSTKERKSAAYCRRDYRQINFCSSVEIGVASCAKIRGYRHFFLICESIIQEIEKNQYLGLRKSKILIV